MEILVLDSSFNQMQAAHYAVDNSASTLTGQNYQVLFANSFEKGSQGEKALDLIQAIATNPQAAKLYAEYNYLMFNRGPGSFVGTRISTSLTQGIATVEPQIKIIAASSLQMVAAQIQQLALLLARSQVLPACLSQGDKILVALDANMGESYIACYSWQAPNTTTTEEQAGMSLVLQGSEQLIKAAELETLYQACTANTPTRQTLITEQNYQEKFGISANEQVILVGNAWSKYLPQATTLCQQLSDESIARNAYPVITAFYEQQLLRPVVNENMIRTGEVADTLDDLFALWEELTSLPDCRWQATLLAAKIAQQDFTPRLEIEPTYIRDKVTY
ncbi:tRNA (adenosine(37)-N6)-threonylcarbamoyltransferase complex dimerization subunit type 1 TsaB [Psittacicella hinzii]|uniref:tRNA (Adenosine(37)-N6)-threonylcarbamoyltransferase complex dimerization subunit type 1 TsaB n=1 Tax=Psittacicella hinzii TaxID=2028575 RepID=A0A3A1YPV9_9GAMM|nr:tRNA (adenosine(37)-N6)-threonylcarbamoyltransferase complex dimerization subunit type 1 TsaB [Psittacicella hinzii]RIY39289.1 tRNA (adenosine(37)-N6)-threonylcarbamoyltransferase complex dimerization subunit type 1 TsaB [Psittacicella hinzii]